MGAGDIHSVYTQGKDKISPFFLLLELLESEPRHRQPEQTGLAIVPMKVINNNETQRKEFYSAWPV